MNFILDKIEERDIDFVVMRAFAEKPAFLSLFLKKIGYEFAEIDRIEHAFTDSELGESDITVVISIEKRKYGLLIENKIDAKAMRDQYARYVMRGEKGIHAGEYEDFAVFLIAPQSYINENDEAKKYSNYISYEEMLHFFSGIHSELDAEIIKKAIEKQAQGYTVQEVPAITDFWRKLYQYCCSSERKIEMYPAEGPKGPRSTWPQFKIPLKGASLYYKSPQGFVDLQFNGKRREAYRLKKDLSEMIDEDEHWADTGESLSLRIKVESIDFRKSFESVTPEIEIMLRAVERLTLFAMHLNDVGYEI